MSSASLLRAHAATGDHRVCVSVSGSTLPELVDRVLQVLAEHPFVELRLDSALNSSSMLVEVSGCVRALLTAYPKARLLATCRSVSAGGYFQGTVDQELRVLADGVAGGCTLVDLAIESADELGLERVAQFRNQLHAQGAALLLSYHNYQQTPDLTQALRRLKRYSPDIVKVVSTATTLTDNLAMLDLFKSPAGVPLLAMAMGEKGIASRVLGPRAGALFTLASSTPGAETAPGQVDASTLRDLYRLDNITGATQIYGVAGHPIRHSLSPLIHNTAFQFAGLDAVFLPLPTSSAEELFRVVRELPISGLSITMPLKQAVLPVLDEVDPLAARVGACNTIARGPEGALRGYNTDVAGILTPLRQRLSLSGARVLVRGAGGAARAAVFGLREEGADVWIVNRTRAAAERLADEAGARVLELCDLQHESFDVLINAIPAGMQGLSPLIAEPGPQTETAAPAELTRLVRSAHLVFDMVYNPLETPLLLEARRQGVARITGLEMFVEQAALQFEHWTQRPAPREKMTQACRSELSQRQNPARQPFTGSD